MPLKILNPRTLRPQTALCIMQVVSDCHHKTKSLREWCLALSNKFLRTRPLRPLTMNTEASTINSSAAQALLLDSFRPPPPQPQDSHQGGQNPQKQSLNPWLRCLTPLQCWPENGHAACPGDEATRQFLQTRLAAVFHSGVEHYNSV